MANPAPFQPFDDRLRAAAETLVLAVVQARDAVRELIDTSRADAGEEARDGTAAAGHVLAALKHVDAIVPPSMLNALRHALDGPRPGADPHRNDSAAALLPIVIAALEHGRKGTPNATEAMTRAAEVWPKHRVWRTATGELDALSKADDAARHAVNVAAHEERRGNLFARTLRRPVVIEEPPDMTDLGADPPVG